MLVSVTLLSPPIPHNLQLLQSGAQVLDDFLGDYVGRRQVLGVLEALVAEPEDV